MAKKPYKKAPAARKADESAPPDAKLVAALEETSDELTEDIFSASLGAIRNEIRGLASGAIDPKPHDRASRIAWLAKNAAAIAAEQRKAKLANLRANRNLTPQQLLAYFKGLSRAERSAWIRDITAMDRNPGVFG